MHDRYIKVNVNLKFFNLFIFCLGFGFPYSVAYGIRILYNLSPGQKPSLCKSRWFPFPQGKA